MIHELGDLSLMCEGCEMWVYVKDGRDSSTLERCTFTCKKCKNLIERSGECEKWKEVALLRQSRINEMQWILEEKEEEIKALKLGPEQNEAVPGQEHNYATGISQREERRNIATQGGERVRQEAGRNLNQLEASHARVSGENIKAGIGGDLGQEGKEKCQKILVVGDSLMRGVREKFKGFAWDVDVCYMPGAGLEHIKKTALKKIKEDKEIGYLVIQGGGNRQRGEGLLGADEEIKDLINEIKEVRPGMKWAITPIWP